MGVLRGTINCKSDQDIPKSSTLTLNVLFISDANLHNPGQNGKAKLIGKMEIPNINKFPIQYKIEYADLPHDLNGLYFVRALINVNQNQNLVLFRNFDIYGSGFYGDLLGKTNRLRKYLDVYLTYEPNSQPNSPWSSPNMTASASLGNMIRLNKIEA
jgi:hypothetical protein